MMDFMFPASRLVKDSRENPSKLCILNRVYCTSF